MINATLANQVENYIKAELSEEFDAWLKKVNKEAAVLAREFDRKKQAFVSAKAGNTISGTLDVARLPEYKFNEDLFSRTKVLPVGQNHKFYVILDWSGSMGCMARAAMQQTVIQAAFLRKLKIDHYITMFGFHANHGRDWDTIQEMRTSLRDGDIYDFDAEQVVLFNEKQSQSEYLLTAKLCFILGEYYGGRRRYWSNDDMGDELKKLCSKNQMGNTPLNISLAEMYNVMKAEHAVAPMVQQNLLIISDGDSHTPNYNGSYRSFASNTIQFEIDGKTKTFPPALLAAGFHSDKRQTYGLISCFDWGVNTIFLFLDDRIRQGTIEFLVGRYVYKNFVEAKMRELKAGKVLSVKNLYGCIDEVIYVGGVDNDNNLSDSTLGEEIGDEDISEMSAAKFKGMMKKSALSNPIQHLSNVMGEALAKNYTLNKHCKGTKQNARAVMMSFDDKYWKNMTNWLTTEATKEKK